LAISFHPFSIRSLISFQAVGVLRMIKMFGWEGKILKRLTNKRQEELVWLWKTKVKEVFYTND